MRMPRYFMAAMMAALFMVHAVIPALAQTPIDLSPLIETGISFLNLLLVAVLGYIAVLVKQKLGVDKTLAAGSDNQMLYAGLQRGVDLAEGAFRRAFIEGREVTVTVNNPYVANVAQRMIDLSPELLDRMGVDEGRLRELAAEMLAARLAKTMPDTPVAAALRDR